MIALILACLLYLPSVAIITVVLVVYYCHKYL